MEIKRWVDQSLNRKIWRAVKAQVGSMRKSETRCVIVVGVERIKSRNIGPANVKRINPKWREVLADVQCVQV